jgi:hypothetical protein
MEEQDTGTLSPGVVRDARDLAGVPVTLTLPQGFRHHTTTGTAESWEAYDALHVTERSWEVDRDYESIRDRIHRQKELEIGGCRIIVFPPHKPRPS